MTWWLYILIIHFTFSRYVLNLLTPHWIKSNELFFPGYTWGMLVSKIFVLLRISVIISEYSLVFLEILGGEI